MVRLRTWIAIAVAALGLYFMGRWQGAAIVAATVAENDARQVLHLKQPYLAHLATLQRTEQTALLVARKWQHRADSLRPLAGQRDTVQFAPDSSLKATWKAVADAEHQSTSACFVSLTACQARADTAEQRAAVLDSSLARLLTVKECKVLFVRCPSRSIVFLVGSGLGFAGGLWLGQR